MKVNVWDKYHQLLLPSKSNNKKATAEEKITEKPEQSVTSQDETSKEQSGSHISPTVSETVQQPSSSTLENY